MNQIDPLGEASGGSYSNSNQHDLFGSLLMVEKPVTKQKTETRKRRRLSTERPTTSRKQPGALVKTFVVDTNVLLHDPQSVQKFADNHVVIPVDVLGELDRFKNEQSERGANARNVHRTLTKLFEGESCDVTRGVPTAGGGSVRLHVPDFAGRGANSKALQRFRNVFSNLERVDHRIIAAAMMIGEESSEHTVLVTKDLNMQLKAKAVGVACEDYLNDKAEPRDVQNYDIPRLPVEINEMQRFASCGELDMAASRRAAIATNDYVLLESSNGKTMPARLYADGFFRRLLTSEHLHIPRGIDIRAVNLGQQCFLDALLDPTIALVTCYGQAGTGKTLLAVAAGLHSVGHREFAGVTISRPVIAMGDTLGYLPGDLDEKMRPWLQPIYDALEVLMPPPDLSQDATPQSSKRKSAKRKASEEHVQSNNGHQFTAYRKPYESLIEQGVLEIEALCYIRGRSIPRRYFVLDEAQQLTPLEAKTLVTRMSKGSKLILVGDPAQIDNPYVDSLSNGLVYTRNRLKGQPAAAHVALSKGERSDLAELGAKLM